jgi:hypothetical protein
MIQYNGFLVSCLPYFFFLPVTIVDSRSIRTLNCNSVTQKVLAPIQLAHMIQMPPSPCLGGVFYFIDNSPQSISGPYFENPYHYSM